MKILLIGSEMAPLAKTGGLGDVLGALPRALAEMGHDVRVCIPGYSFIKTNTNDFSRTAIKGEVRIADSRFKYTVIEYAPSKSNSIGYLIQSDDFFNRSDLYTDSTTGRDYEDNDIRFAFFCRAALDIVQLLRWQPDIVHLHDWQSALTAAYINQNEKLKSVFGGSKIVLTIHNIAYQGKFPKERFSKLDLPTKLVDPLGPFEFYGESNFLKGGIMFADKITTVSETYAREIQDELGCGLEGVLLSRKSDLSGIINGVDYAVWSPQTDRLIPKPYHTANLSGKKANKIELLRESALPIRTDTPLIGIVTRLVEQKGIQLVIDSASQLFTKNIQMIILGTGDKKIERQLKFLESKFPDKLKVFLRFDEALAHKIEAGSDIFLMPSIFEPCGLNQMYSLKYGTPPIVHNVGGLADTVVDYNATTGEGTGFVFKAPTPDSMMSAVERAIELYSKKRKWMKLMKNGMNENFSWKKSALKHVELFENTLRS